MSQLSEFYLERPKKSFLTIATSIMVLCDIFILTYIYLKFSNDQFFQFTLGMSFQLNGLDINNVDPELVTNLYNLFHRTLKIMIALAAAYHLINYICWWKEKAFAIAYAKFLAMIGGPLIILWGGSLLVNGSNIGLIFIALGALLFSLLPGIKHHFPT